MSSWICASRQLWPVECSNVRRLNFFEITIYEPNRSIWVQFYTGILEEVLQCFRILTSVLNLNHKQTQPNLTVRVIKPQPSGPSLTFYFIGWNWNITWVEFLWWHFCGWDFLYTNGNKGSLIADRHPWYANIICSTLFDVQITEFLRITWALQRWRNYIQFLQ